MEQLTQIFLENGIWGVFVASFLAATIIPFASELVVVGVIAAGCDPWTVLISATVGNVLGGLTNYLLGMLFDLEKVTRWMRVKPEKVQKMYPFVHKYDYFLASLAFMPVLGTPVMIALGILRSNFLGVVVFSALFKFIRYAVIIYTQVNFFT